MGQLSFLICVDSKASRDSWRRSLDASGHARVDATIFDPAKLASEVAALRPDAVLATFQKDPRAMLEAIEQLPAARPLIVISGPLDDSCVLVEAIRLGVKGFLPPEPDDEEVRVTVQRLVLEQAGLPATQKSPAPLISVIGAKGGIGATTVACQLAARLQRNAPTVLIDLDLAGGDVGLHFDVNPQHSVADLSGKAAQLDATYVHMLLHPHRTGLQILTSPARPEQVDLVDTPSLERALEILREEFEWVVVDVSRSWRESSLRTLDLSDQILLVTGFDVAALHHSRRLEYLFRRLGQADRLRLIANRRSSSDSVGERDFRQFLERQPDVRLPNDFESTTACIEQGKPISEIAENRALDRGFLELAQRVHDWCGVPFPEPARRKGLISNLLAKVVRNGTA